MRCSKLLPVLFLLAAPGLAAQTPQAGPQPRTGFWISVGLSGGPKWLSCDLCSEKFGNGFGGSLALGGTISEQVLIGADVVGFFPFANMDEGYDETSDGFGAALFTTHYYPRVASGLFVVGGIGLGEIDEQADLLEAKGFVGKIGLGYDLRAGRNFSFTPSISLVQSFATEAERAGQVMEGNMNFGMLQFGIAATWH